MEKLKSMKNQIQLGICCMNNSLRDRKPTIFCARTMNIATLKNLGVDEAKSRALQNVKDLKKLIKWNHHHNIHCLRISSDMFPHLSNTRLEDEYRYTIDFALKELKKSGDYAQKYRQRITMHPGQYDVIGTPKPEVFEATRVDLKMHADILDAMNVNQNGVLVIHGGGVYGDKKGTINRWCENFFKLDECIRRRLVIENDEKSYNIEDCLEISERINIPVVFDTHHFECYKIQNPKMKFKSPEDYMKPVLDTWIKRNIKPKFHISEQMKDCKLGTHSEYVKIIPNYLLEIPQKYDISIDIMIEAKGKEASILKLYEKYPFLKSIETIDDLDTDDDLDFTYVRPWKSKSNANSEDDDSLPVIQVGNKTKNEVRLEKLSKSKGKSNKDTSISKKAKVTKKATKKYTEEDDSETIESIFEKSLSSGDEETNSCCGDNLKEDFTDEEYEPENSKGNKKTKSNELRISRGKKIKDKDIKNDKKRSLTAGKIKNKKSIEDDDEQIQENKIDTTEINMKPVKKTRSKSKVSLVSEQMKQKEKRKGRRKASITPLQNTKKKKI